MSIEVTIYNDDEHGQDIQVLQINPYGAQSFPPVVQEAGEGGKNHHHCYKLRNGELLIVSTAEKELPGNGDGE